jgi:diaminopimelate decarboxylase
MVDATEVISSRRHIGYDRPHGILAIDGVGLDEVAAQVGTPAYVYSLAGIEANYRRIDQAFAPLGGSVFYSVKANANLTVLRSLRRLGAGFDVVSGGELARVLRAGADPRRVSFAGVGKTDEEIAFAVRQGVIVHVESLPELDRLAEISAGTGCSTRFGLRINPGVTVDTLPGMRTGADRAKFGVSPAQAREVIAACAAGRYGHLVPVGVHMHVGSQLPRPEDQARAAAVLLDVLASARRAGLSTMRRLDIGGGFPVQYDQPDLPSPAAFADELRALVPGADVDLVVEPGRSVVASAGVLLAKVLYTKPTATGPMLVVDTGMHHLIRPALYGAHHRILPVRDAPAVADMRVVGPICESTDELANAALPELRRGDLVAVMDAGAYGMVMASNYNGQPRPPEVVISDGAVTIARRRETWEDLMAFDE